MDSRLTFISSGADGKALYRCLCGTEKEISTRSVARGLTKSCGCLRVAVAKARMTTHGLYGTRAHVSWSGMKTRCTNPRSTRFSRYGGRGIGICKRWLKFENFFDDMGQPPLGHSLERLDNNMGYSPGNCVWAPLIQQARNKSNTMSVIFRGKKRTLGSLSEEFGVDRKLLWERIRCNDISVERAVQSKDLRRRQ